MPNLDPQLSAPLLDSHLRCPHCQYNLTGLLQNRCPECGHEFDPETLLRRATGNIPTPATSWDSAPPYNLKAFCQTWLLAAFHPRKLARDFPACHDHRRARSYSRTCSVISLTLLLAACLTRVRRAFDLAGIFVFTPIAWLSACLACRFCELLLAAYFDDAIEGNSSDSPPAAIARWSGLMRYCTGFSNLSACWVAVSILFPKLADGSLFPVFQPPYCFLSGLIVVVLWWLIAISAMAYERSRRWSQAVLACIVTLFNAAVCISLGCLMAFFPMFILSRLLNV